MGTNNLIISVESRKGGVGKTTAALVLAKLYLKKRYRVLFLDLDLTGTNVLFTIPSPFWNKITHAVKWNDKNADVLDLFCNNFMTRGYSPKFSIKAKNDSGLLSIQNNKINIMGSDINDKKINIKPSILFDEIHSHWFVEFLQQISNDFISKNSGFKTAIILDNSPGYVGFVSGIHEWLTDLGPEKAKFLVISSLDDQDLISCFQHIEDLHSRFISKHSIALKFLSDNSSIEIDNKEIDFYLRLVETEFKDQRLNSFIEPNILKRLGDYKSHPEKYIEFVINKVLEGITTGYLNYDFKEIIKKLKFPPKSYYYEINNTDQWETYIASRMIPYDEYIEYQFFLNTLTTPSISGHKRKSIYGLINLIDKNIEQVKGHINYYELGIDTYKQTSNKTIINIIEAIKLYQVNINNIINQFEIIGYRNLIKLFGINWQPSGFAIKLEIVFEDLLDNIGYNQHRYHRTSYENISIDKESQGEFNYLMNYLFKEINRQYDIKESDVISQLLSSYLIALYLIGGLRFVSKSEESFLSSLTVPIIYTQYQNWKISRKDKINRLPGFLINQKLSKAQHNNLIDNLRFMGRNKTIVNKLIMFYKEISKTQARILDLQGDYEFLLLVMSQVLRQNKEKIPILPYVRGLLDKVIINKTLSHKMGIDKLVKGISSYGYLERFEKLIGDIIKKWGQK
jgi:cellulose biosynthesis protein BcsQ